MTIRAKIALLATALLVLLAVVAGVALDGLWRVQHELRSLHRDVLPLDVMIETLAQQEIEREAQLYAVLRSAEDPAANARTIGRLLTKEAMSVAALMETITDHADDIGHDGIAERLEEPRKTLIESGETFSVVARDLAGLLNGADKQAVDQAFDRLIDAGQMLRKSLDGLSAAMRNVVEDATGRAEEHEARVINSLIVAAVLALTTGFFGSIYLSGLITRPIRALVAAAKRVEGGALDVEVPARGSDEMAGFGRTFNMMVEGLRTKERIKETFGKYIDPRIVEGLIGNTDLLDSSRRPMTVSIAQYDRFGEFAEGKTPDQIVDRINTFYAAMSAAVAERNGVVDKMMGDTVLTFFGPPFTPADNHAELACLAALQQVRWLPAGRERGHGARVAIASDVSIVGNMGSEQIRTFTIMGDNMALADLMLKVCEDYEADVLVTDGTCKLLNDDFVTRHLDTTMLPGREQPVELHQVIGLARDVAADEVAFIANYETAFAAYVARDFDRARDMFRECAVERPLDAATAILLQRLDMIELDPPEDDWSGAWLLTAS